MKLRVFQSDHGDCLLLTTADGKNMLIDGGLGGSFAKHAAPFLGALGGPLDLVYVSHIDGDHIRGILKMLDTKVAWKVHAFQTSRGLSPDPPELPEPPDVTAIWHNGFGDFIDDDTAPISDQLSARAAALSTSERFHGAGLATGSLATSVSEGVEPWGSAQLWYLLFCLYFGCEIIRK